jgi:hypothetical protein
MGVSLSDIALAQIKQAFEIVMAITLLDAHLLFE